MNIEHQLYITGTPGYILKPAVMWNSSHILFERFLPASKTQEGLHVTHISLTIVSGQYVCRENYSASPLVEVEVSQQLFFEYISIRVYAPGIPVYRIFFFNLRDF